MKKLVTEKNIMGRKRGVINGSLLLTSTNKVAISVHNSLVIDEYDETVAVIPQLVELINKAAITGSPHARMGGDDMEGYLTHFVLVSDLIVPIWQGILSLKNYLHVDWLDEYNLCYESEYFADGDKVLKCSKDFTKCLISLEGKEWDEIKEVEADLYFGKSALDKLLSAEYTPYTTAELDLKTKDELNTLRVAIETATGEDLGVTTANIKDEIKTAIVNFLNLDEGEL